MRAVTERSLVSSTTSNIGFGGLVISAKVLGSSLVASGRSQVSPGSFCDGVWENAGKGRKGQDF